MTELRNNSIEKTIQSSRRDDPGIFSILTTRSVSNVSSGLHLAIKGQV